MTQLLAKFYFKQEYHKIFSSTEELAHILFLSSKAHYITDFLLLVCVKYTLDNSLGWDSMLFTVSCQVGKVVQLALPLA